METTIITFGLGVVLTLTVLAILSLFKSNKKIGELDSLIDDVESGLNSRLDSIEKYMDDSYFDLDKRLDSRVDRTISQFEKELEEIDKRLNELSFNLSSLKKEEERPL